MLTKTEIEKYFIAEKQSGLLLLCLGIIALAISLYIIFSANYQTFKITAFMLLLFGILAIGFGYKQQAVSNTLRVNLVYAFDMNPDLLKTAEIPRLNNELTNLTVFKYLIILAGIAAIGMFVLAKKYNGYSFLFSSSITLFILVFVLLAFYIFQIKNTTHYYQLVKQFVS